MLDQDIIFRPSVLGKLQDVHKFLARIGVKANMVKHLGAAVEIPAVIMERMGSIPKGAQSRRRALALTFFKHRLIRILTRPEIPQVHARENLKLRICRSRSHGRHFKIPGGIIFIHFT